MRSIFTTLTVSLFVLILAGCQREQAERELRLAEERAKQALAEAQLRAWQTACGQALAGIKSEYAKIFPSKSEYDLVFDTPEMGDDKLKAHQARLAKMDRVEVKGVTVGYEQRQDTTLGGKAFERHFRATWIADDKVVGVSYYTQEKTDLAAFVDLLQRLVPATNEVLRHVQFKRGETQ